jgi:hypothetical protein
MERLRRYLPLHGSFFGGIDFGDFWDVAEEVAFDVVEQKRLRVGIREIQAVVIDDLCLLLQPPAPALLAYFCRDALAELVGKGRERKGRALFAAVCAFDCVSHDDLFELIAFEQL